MTAPEHPDTGLPRVLPDTHIVQAPESAHRQLRGLLAKVQWYADEVADLPENERATRMRERYRR